jgi:hypothetical protein
MHGVFKPPLAKARSARSFSNKKITLKFADRRDNKHRLRLAGIGLRKPSRVAKGQKEGTEKSA